MSTVENKSTLKSITNRLLSSTYTTIELYHAIKDYQNLLSEIYSLDDENGINFSTPLYLPSGKAISSKEAARCLYDFKRTSHFIRGLHKAILSCQKQFPNEKIHILYAGTGPFAALALPMTTIFSPESISFTFLEVTPDSMEHLHQTIAFFGISDYVRAAVLTDATQFIPSEGTIHILLSETMQQSLRDEPQVAITLQLAPFLHPKSILVPQEINVGVALINAGKLQEAMFSEVPVPSDYYMLKLTDLLCLNRDYRPDNQAKSITINAEQIQNFPDLHYITEIKIFENEVLTFRESPLTSPEQVVKHLDAKDLKCTFLYKMGERPGFTFEIIQTNPNIHS